MRYFVEMGANIHGYNELPLILSDQPGHFEIVRYLTEMGSNIHEKNEYALKNVQEMDS